MQEASNQIHSSKYKALFLFLIKFILPLLLSLAIYWPVYIPIKIESSKTNLGQETKTLDLQTEEYLKFFTNIPLAKHELCFKNNNKVYLIHSDSFDPFIFKTDDVSMVKKIKEDNVGAMTIWLFYKDNSKRDFYRKIGSEECENFDIKKFATYYASSTIEYSHAFLSSAEELDFPDKQKILLRRNIGQSFVDTGLSKAYIKLRTDYFFFTYIILTLFWSGVISLLKRKKPTSGNTKQVEL